MEQRNRKRESECPWHTDRSGRHRFSDRGPPQRGWNGAGTRQGRAGGHRKAAATPLIKLLSDDHEQVRWEAAKALSEIRDPRAAEPLVAALEDERFDTRWVAAEGLIALGRASLLPLLRMLATGKDSTWLREGAHHVLEQMSDGGGSPKRWRPCSPRWTDLIRAQRSHPPHAEP